MASYRELAAMLGAFVRAVETHQPPTPKGTLMERATTLLHEAHRGLMVETKWTPFVRVHLQPLTPERLSHMAEQLKLPVATVQQMVDVEREGFLLFANSRYQVAVRRDANSFWLNIKRIDQQAIRNWRDLQRIKNELIGPEFEAIELFPAEHRKIDEANQYHLFGSLDPTHDWGVGFDEGRKVSRGTDIGEMQEPFEEGEEP